MSNSPIDAAAQPDALREALNKLHRWSQEAFDLRQKGDRYKADVIESFANEMRDAVRAALAAAPAGPPSHTALEYPEFDPVLYGAPAGPVQPTPDAWLYEEALSIVDGVYTAWTLCVSLTKPDTSDDSFRNITPLFRAVQPTPETLRALAEKWRAYASKASAQGPKGRHFANALRQCADALERAHAAQPEM